MGNRWSRLSRVKSKESEPVLSRSDVQSDTTSLSLGPGIRSDHSSDGQIDLTRETAKHRKVYGQFYIAPVKQLDQWRTRNWSDLSQEVRKVSSSSAPFTKEEEDYLRTNGIEFQKQIGFGAYGTVWLCRFTDPVSCDSSLVACKLLDIFKQKSIANIALSDAIDLMMSEAEIMYTLSHKNVVKCNHVFHIHDPNTDFPLFKVLIFMELCEGDVSHLLNSRPDQKLSEDEAQSVMLDVCKGLKHLHDNNIVHLDIKPNNILYTNEGSAGKRAYKLTDFGLAKRFARTSRTRINVGLGTPRYRAPELNDLGYSDAKSADIFSLGTVLAELLVGSYEFVSARTDLQKDFQSALAKWELSYQVASLVRRMTFKRPESRLTIDEVLADDWIGDDEAFDAYLAQQKRRF